MTCILLVGGRQLCSLAQPLLCTRFVHQPHACLTSASQHLLPLPFPRIEHPQELVNKLQYGAEDAAHVLRGKGPYPVAEYRLAAEISAAAAAQAAAAVGGGDGSGWLADNWYQPLLASGADGAAGSQGSEGPAAGVPSARGVYSFCMCPGKLPHPPLGCGCYSCGCMRTPPPCTAPHAVPACCSVTSRSGPLGLQAAKSCPPPPTRRSCASTA